MPCRPLVFFIALALCAAAPALLSTTTASAQVPLLNTYGGPLGFGFDRLPENDDGSSGAISLTPAFPSGLRFFGGPYTQMWVNNNGNITFSGPVGTYTPMPFPVAARPMIAPYWGDVDTRGGYTTSRNGVFWHLEPGRIVVTWFNVGYYSSHDDRQMSFQLILTNALDCGSGDFEVEFRYNVCGWTTGDASGGSGGFGGTPAQAGFDAGNSVDFVEIPGSRTMSILNVCTTSNVGMPGIWRFSVRGGMVACPDAGDLCNTGMMGACGLGLTQCVGRETMCLQVGTSSGERCDGIDNDCNGMTDEGMGLCSGFDICVDGRCVPPCFEGGCSEGFTCNTAGACVETSCLDVTCPPGARCLRGECVDGCGGITCPHGQQCFAGRCTDLCAVLDCGAESICVDGACVPTCPCRPCADDEICGGDGECRPVGCDVVICDPGYYCAAGECLDSCVGAVCPAGQVCRTGECIEDSGMLMPDAGIPPGTDGGVILPGTDGGGAGWPDAGPSRTPGRRAGCSCRTNGGGTQGGALLMLGLLGLALVRVRRRRA